MNEYKDRNGPALDNTIVLFGSGASTTHNSHNLPDAASRRRKHGPEAWDLLARGRVAHVEHVSEHSACHWASRKSHSQTAPER